jgi:hypothetical protein
MRWLLELGIVVASIMAGLVLGGLGPASIVPEVWRRLVGALLVGVGSPRVVRVRLEGAVAVASVVSADTRQPTVLRLLASHWVRGVSEALRGEHEKQCELLSLSTKSVSDRARELPAT